jgi:hypothetical protein
VPTDSQPGGGYAIRIRDTDDWNSYDVSDTFTIADAPSCSYQVDEPTATSTWRMGETHGIAWSSSDGCEGNVDLDLLRAGDSVAPIAEGIEDAGTFSWAIPVDLEAADDYQVRVAAVDDPDHFDVSPQFRIEAAVDPPEVRVYWVEIASHQAGQAGSIWRTDVVARICPKPTRTWRSGCAARAAARCRRSSPAGRGGVRGRARPDGRRRQGLAGDHRESAATGVGTDHNLGDEGTFGQYLEGYPEGGGLAQGVVGTLLQLRQLEGEFRTNIGFTNPSSTDGAVQFTLFDAGGTELILYRVDLDPRALVQDLEPYSRRASRLTWAGVRG